MSGFDGINVLSVNAYQLVMDDNFKSAVLTNSWFDKANADGSFAFTNRSGDALFTIEQKSGFLILKASSMTHASNDVLLEKHVSSFVDALGYSIKILNDYATYNPHATANNLSMI
jgi:hypothetical protein